VTPNHRQRWSVGPQVVFGLAIVFFGLLLTAKNLNMVGPLGNAIRFWPLAFTAFGIALLLEEGSSSSRRLFGGALVVGGLWQTANTAFGLGIYIEDYWPMVLVGVGVLLVLRAISPSTPPAEDYTNMGAPMGGAASMPAAASPSLSSPATDTSARDETINAFAFMGGVRRNIISPAFRGGNVTAIMGGVVLDLRQSQAVGGETVVEVFAIWGGIEVKVPPDWQVVNEISPIMGGVEDRSAHTPPTRHRLVLKGVVLMAGVEVKS
jgi:hypothetical protein